MLRELWDYLTTPAPAEARALGYVTESVALAARFRRQSRAWKPHVAACHAFIRDAAALAPAGGRALVAGSGLLIEVPLDALAARFAEVVLADLVHPRAARRAAAAHPNVRLLTLDLSGVAAPLHRARHDRGIPPPDPSRAVFPPGPFDFAVSCNLLSQLPLLPDRALGRRGAGDEERLTFAQGLIRAHLAGLRAAAPVAALFTDTETLWLRDGRLNASDDSLWGVTVPPPDRRWAWAIAPAPEEDRRSDRHHRVGGWLNLNAAPPATPGQGPDASSQWDSL